MLYELTATHRLDYTDTAEPARILLTYVSDCGTVYGLDTHRLGEGCVSTLRNLSEAQLSRYIEVADKYADEHEVGEAEVNRAALVSHLLTVQRWSRLDRRRHERRADVRRAAEVPDIETAAGLARAQEDLHARDLAAANSAAIVAHGWERTDWIIDRYSTVQPVPRRGRRGGWN